MSNAANNIEIDTGTDELLCSLRDRVAIITLNRPQARNSLRTISHQPCAP